MRDADRILHRFEIDVLTATLILTLLALAAPGGGALMAVSVLAGGAFVWASFRTLKGSVDAALRRSRRPAALVKVFTRYGILALAAYVMLARLRLHPVGVVIGSSSLALAAAAVAVRSRWSSGSRRAES